MFQSATLKLTGWYLLILMTISIVFSIAIYHIAAGEIDSHLRNLQSGLVSAPDFIGAPPTNQLRIEEVRDASTSIGIELFYANTFILIGGGAGSYFLARRTLRPIEKAHMAQSRFTSDASHELRTPLAAMKAEIEVTLRDKNSTPDEMREILSSNLEEVEKLSQLSEMLLTLSRLDHDKFETKSVDLITLVQSAVKNFDVTSDRLHITAPSQVIIEGNDSATRELIAILVDNALKYSPPDSIVSVIITTEQSFAKFTITNSGAGIDQEKLPYIFDRFYRADSSRTGGQQKGYGLGLSLAKQIIELQRGELSVTSGKNQPTVFTARLPLFHDTQAKNQK